MKCVLKASGYEQGDGCRRNCCAFHRFHPSVPHLLLRAIRQRYGGYIVHALWIWYRWARNSSPLMGYNFQKGKSSMLLARRYMQDRMVLLTVQGTRARISLAFSEEFRIVYGAHVFEALLD